MEKFLGVHEDSMQVDMRMLFEMIKKKDKDEKYKSVEKIKFESIGTDASTFWQANETVAEVTEPKPQLACKKEFRQVEISKQFFSKSKRKFSNEFWSLARKSTGSSVKIAKSMRKISRSHIQKLPKSSYNQILNKIISPCRQSNLFSPLHQLKPHTAKPIPTPFIKKFLLTQDKLISNTPDLSISSTKINPISRY